MQQNIITTPEATLDSLNLSTEEMDYVSAYRLHVAPVNAFRVVGTSAEDIKQNTSVVFLDECRERHVQLAKKGSKEVIESDPTIFGVIKAFIDSNGKLVKVPNEYTLAYFQLSPLQIGAFKSASYDSQTKTWIKNYADMLNDTGKSVDYLVVNANNSTSALMGSITQIAALDVNLLETLGTNVYHIADISENNVRMIINVITTLIKFNPLIKNKELLLRKPYKNTKEAIQGAMQYHEELTTKAEA